MTGVEEYQKILSVGNTTVYENHKYYLIRRQFQDSDSIYPKKDWTLKEVLDDAGISILEANN
ncbi:MAG: hypothetical protein R6U04_02090 [Bacteroidales bacterium]